MVASEEIILSIILNAKMKFKFNLQVIEFWVHKITLNKYNNDFFIFTFKLNYFKLPENVGRFCDSAFLF